MGKRFWAALAGGVALFCSQNASAALVQWRVTGTVSQVIGQGVIDSVGGSATVGDAFEINYWVDPSLGQNGGTATFARWDGAIQYTTFKAGSWSYAIEPMSYVTSKNDEILAADNDPGVGYLYGMASADWLNGVPNSDAVQATWYAQAWGGPSFLGSTDILTAPWVLSDFSYINGPVMEVDVARGNSTGAIQGSITSIEALSNATLPGPLSPTPEPSSWALLLVGFGFVGAMLRARVSRRTWAIELTSNLGSEVRGQKAA